MNLLHDFKNRPFIEAVQSFFKNLNVPVNEITTAPATAIDIIGENPVNAAINEVYAYGIVDDAIFEHNETFKNLEDVKSLKADYDGILIFGITLHPRDNNLLPTRAQLADITRAFSRAFKHTPITIVFKYGNHIAFANSERTQFKQQWREGEKVGKVTILRDVFIEKPHSGHERILRNLEIKKSGSKIIETFEDLYKHWQEVLNVSVLNKAFYEELVNWYFWAIKKVTFPNEPIQETDENYSDYFERLKAHRAQNVIRLITRLMFTWFIKEKNLVPTELFDQSFLKNNIDFGDNDSSNYYKAILQNLFFATLNQEMSNREFRKEGQNVTITNLYRYKKLFNDENIALKLFKNVPFLNGGLFECLDRGLDKIDGFSQRKDCTMIFPNELFFSEEQFEDLTEDYGQTGKKYQKAPVRGLINLLNDYVFTVTENTPVEEDVALDPELLGKVFENLLASYNPETKTTARKQTGSFYTPREIVNYMVNESLIAYLKNELLKEVPGYVDFGKSQTNLFGNEVKKGQLSLETKIEENPFKESEETLELQLHQLFSYETIQPFTDDKVKNNVIIALDKCKILDPACGSGAYPMGVLHKMVHVLQKVDPENKHWKALQKQKAIQETQEAYDLGDKQERELRLIEINDAFDEGINDPDYARKLFLIENCIYGVDIQPVAVQISKLRFFISLVVDQKPTQDVSKNRGIRPLPNLETKFVAANTLIGLDKPKQLMLRNPEIENLEKLLADVRHNHFSAKTPKTKEKWRTRDKELRNEIRDLLIDDGWNTTSANQVANWDPYNQNTSSDFFDTEWMFGFENGFDLVIGNPPYIGEKGNEAVFHKMIGSDLYKRFYTRWMDYFYYFFHFGLDALKKDGILSYITTNYYFTSTGGIKLREDIKKRATIFSIVDFNEIKVFESARGQHNSITILTKGKKELITESIICNSNLTINESHLNLILNGLDKDTFYSKIKSTNIFDGSDFQIRIKGINSGNNIDTILDLIAKKSKTKLGDISQITMGVVTLSDTFSGKHSIDYPNINAVKGDGIYVLNDDELNSLNLGIETKQKIIKPFFKNSDIYKYGTKTENELWLIYLKDLGKPLNLEENLKKHFERFSSLIIGLKENFLKNPIAASVVKKWFKNGNYFVLFTPKKEEYFVGEKIVFPYRSKTNIFAYSKTDFFGSKDIGYILKKDANYNLKYLLTLLNSKLMFVWLYNRGKRKGETLELYTKPLNDVPVVSANINYQKILISFTDILSYLIEKKNNKFYFFYDIVDGLVFELYFTEHMKDKNIDIYSFVQEDIKAVLGEKEFEKLSEIEKQNSINELEKRWTSADNEVRNRIKLFAVRSPDILKPILESK